MEKNEYIEFEFKSEDRFNDFLKVFKLISNSKKSEDYISDEFWFGQFPDYALQNYYFSDSDLKATEIDEGGGVYNVQWTSETEFKLTEIKDTLNKHSLLSKIKKFFSS